MACQPRHAPVAYARELETQIRRFPRGFRHRLRKLVRGSSRFGELLFTFPGLAFVLAIGGRPHAARGRAAALVKDGRTLSEAAEALDLPIWMRRLPPEAFAEPLGSVPGSQDFGRRIVNEIPDKVEVSAMWLRWVLFAAASCDECFALWVARQKIYHTDDGGKLPLLPLAAFAWFSREDSGPARGLIVKPWDGAMRFGSAVEEMHAWFERVVLDYCREGGARNGTWFKIRKVCGYRIVPLLTADELKEEGSKMNNCVATYIPKALSGDCLIYSIRRGGKNIATMEIAQRQGAPVIVQLFAPGNATASEDIWRAAQGWLSKQGRYPMVARDDIALVPVIPSRWEAIWRPYWDARPQFKTFLTEPSMGTLGNLRQQIGLLARLVKG